MIRRLIAYLSQPIRVEADESLEPSRLSSRAAMLPEWICERLEMEALEQVKKMQLGDPKAVRREKKK